MIKKIKRYEFLFEELVKRDFKKKYKRTVLGMAWSVLSPLLTAPGRAARPRLGYPR